MLVFIANDVSDFLMAKKGFSIAKMTISLKHERLLSFVLISELPHLFPGKIVKNRLTVGF